MQALEFESRDTTPIELSDLSSDIYDSPEKLVLRLTDIKRTIDIGSLAYAKRSPATKKPVVGEYNIKSVVTGSLLEHRKHFIVKLLDEFSLHKPRSRTICTRTQDIFAIANWADQNDHSNFLNSIEDARNAYVAYTDYLYQCIWHTKRYKLRSAGTKQSQLRQIFRINFDRSTEEIIFGIQKIKTPRKYGGKEPPEKEHVKTIFNTNLNLATSISNFLVKGKSFPHKVQLPRFTTYLYPHLEFQAKTPYTTKLFPKALDTENGRVRTLEELQALYPNDSNSVSILAIENANGVIADSNSNLRCHARLRYANLALGAYHFLIGAILGANTQEMCDFEYDKVLISESVGALATFSTIKYRANGKNISYEINSIEGMRILEQYIQFREWLLEGHKFKYFFLKIKSSMPNSGAPRQLNPEYDKKHHKRCSGVYVDPQLTRITPGLARKYKSYILKEIGFSNSTVANLLDHNLKTNQDSYSNAPQSEKHLQWQSFIESIRVSAEKQITNKEIDKSKSIPSGSCKDYGKPASTQDNTIPIEPNCRVQLGCLGCENYVVHNDQQDTRKLLSLKYVVDYMATNNSNAAHAHSLFSELTVRIDAIVNAIAQKSKKSAAMVTELKIDVLENGHVTPFWERRLDLFDKSSGIL